jgi:hypothetical protein
MRNFQLLALLCSRIQVYCLQADRKYDLHGAFTHEFGVDACAYRLYFLAYIHATMCFTLLQDINKPAGHDNIVLPDPNDLLKKAYKGDIELLIVVVGMKL